MDVHLRFDFYLVETTTFELLSLQERLVGCSLSRRHQLKVLCSAPHKKEKICYKKENSLLQSPWIICIAIMQRFAKKKETSFDIVDKRNLHCLIWKSSSELSITSQCHQFYESWFEYFSVDVKIFLDKLYEEPLAISGSVGEPG